MNFMICILAVSIFMSSLNFIVELSMKKFYKLGASLFKGYCSNVLDV